MPWHVYLLRCADGSLYTGVTTDLPHRLAAHNAGRAGAAYTRSRRPVTLAWSEAAADRSAALRREHAIKRLSRRDKEALIRTTPPAAKFGGFGPGALRFLRGLARNNDRDWFAAHRAEFEHELRAPMAALVEEVDVVLARLAPELTGDPKRSVFRLHRDVRFSADKSPYKTWLACQFYHADAGRGAGRDASEAGAAIYFQIAPRDSFVAGGLWMPAAPGLRAVREALQEGGDDFAEIVDARAFRRRFGELDREGMLTRLPRGYAAGGAAERWLRYRSFTATRPLSDAEVTAPGLLRALTRDIELLVPFVRWLNAALGRPPRSAR